MTTPVTVLGEKPSLRTRSMSELFRPHLGAAGLGVLWLLVSNALLLLVPRLVNDGIAAATGEPAPGKSFMGLIGGITGLEPKVTTIVAFIVVAAVLGGVVRVMSRVVLFNVGRDVERALRSELFAHMSTLSPTFYHKNSVGDLMSRLTNDMTNVRLMAGFALLNALNALIIFVFTLPVMFSLDARVAGLSLLPFPVVILIAQSVTRLMFVRTKENQEALGRLTTAVQENLAGQQVVRAFSREEGERARFHKTTEDVYGAAMRLASIRLVLGPIMGLMGSLAIGVCLYTGGQEIAAGHLGVGDVVEMNTRLIQLAWPTVAMGFILSVYQRGKASLARINELLVVVPDIVDGPVTKAVEGRIEARGLAVEVAPGKRALEDFDVVVEPGRVLGVVGLNGSGKSTFLRALARQTPCPRGQLFVDGVDVNDWHLRSLHEGIGVVPEDGFLFSATVKENLAFGRPDATDDEVEAVIDLVDLRRDLSAFPEGKDTVVGERGVTLSGGQRQRVALGRAILATPAVLLLDDSLSAVDAETEARIVASLRKGFVVDDAGTTRPPTLVVVSHRLSAVRDAHEIVVLDNGRVVERGTHGALLEKNGLYADLWGREQLRQRLEGPRAAE
jgi:ATP-binding cassette subfamily B protein